MHNGRMYMDYNFAQRKSALEVLNNFHHHFKWPNGNEGKLLDIGSGSGDVLIELVVPKLPKTVKIYGTDVSAEMVKFAKQNFGTQVASFYQADISADYELLAKRLPQPFDNITSFFCFHWIQNQRFVPLQFLYKIFLTTFVNFVAFHFLIGQKRKAIENVYKLLKPHGTVLMEFLSSSPVFEIYQELSNYKIYEIYMKDVKNAISPYHHSDNPLKMFRDHTNIAGFQTKHLEIRDQIYIYENADQLKSNAI